MKRIRPISKPKKRRTSWRVLAVAGAGVFFVLAAFTYRLGWRPVPSYPLDSRASIKRLSVGALATSSQRSLEPTRFSVGSGTVDLVPLDEIADVDDPSFADLSQEFSKFSPDLALIDGALGLAIGSDASIVRKFGTAGAVAVLAKRSGTAFLNMNPTPESRYAMLSRKFTAADIVAFSSIRKLQSESLPLEATDKRMIQIIEETCADFGLENSVFANIEAFDDFWTRAYPKLPDWRHLSSTALLPISRNAPADSTLSNGYKVLSAIATEESDLNVEFAIAAIIDAAIRGNRVFVVTTPQRIQVQQAEIQELLAHQKTFFREGLR